MRLFHVSEEPDIQVFVPRVPLRKELDQTKGLVWALNEAGLPNFLTPRECPRVTWLASSGHRCLAIEHAWHKRMLNTTLYIYEFDPARFYLQDMCAGYYVSEHTERPIGWTRIDDLYGALFEHGVEVRLVNNLWPLRDAVVNSTVNFSICDMWNAQPKE